MFIYLTEKDRRKNRCSGERRNITRLWPDMESWLLNSQRFSCDGSLIKGTDESCPAVKKAYQLCVPRCLLHMYQLRPKASPSCVSYRDTTRPTEQTGKQCSEGHHTHYTHTHTQTAIISIAISCTFKYFWKQFYYTVCQCIFCIYFYIHVHVGTSTQYRGWPPRDWQWRMKGTGGHYDIFVSTQ